MAKDKNQKSESNCENFGTVKVFGTGRPALKNCRKCKKDNTEQFENCLAAANAPKERTGQRYSSKNYKSGRALVIALIGEGKHTADQIKKAYHKEFPEAPKNGCNGYLSWSLNEKTYRRTNKVMAKTNKAGVMSWSKKVPEASK